jgi:iron complex outermembrane recepter protein
MFSKFIFAMGFLLVTSSQAQSSETTLAPVTVTANPLGNAQVAAPVSSLGGDDLVLRRASSLGETLKMMPGVSSSYFGPNASRPTIRGLDGERVKILSNAGSSLDASALSFDHAVPIDPLIVERIEVLRGPGSMLYGGSALGGVVNALDNRIPKKPVEGVAGAVELRLGGAQRERAGVALVEAGTEKFTWHVDAFGRKTSDLTVPRHTPMEGDTALPQTRRVRNSAAQTQGGALGGSLFFDQGYVGLSVDSYDSHYGTVADPGVSIQMKRHHLGLAGEFKPQNNALLNAVRGQVNTTQYQHEEIEGSGAVGTTFKNSGHEVRFEFDHVPMGNMKGMLGVQLERSSFSALGEEAFVPATLTQKQALFMLEQLPWVGGTFSAGARAEQVQVDSAGDANAAEASKFGAPQKRRFMLGSASVSNLMKLGAQWSFSTALSYTERAPTSFELYANGLHAATAEFEVGRAQLGPERGTNLDVSATWKDKHSSLRLGVFATYFSSFISLDNIGNTRLQVVDGEIKNLTETQFNAVRARLAGIELEGQHRLINQPWTLDISGKLDLTRGRNLDTHQALPRIAPLRLSVGLEAKHGLYSGKVGVEHHARQTRVPATDVPTDDFTVLNLSVQRRLSFSEKSDGVYFVKLTNLTNTLGYSATSVQTVRGLSPLPGRALALGLRVGF